MRIIAKQFVAGVFTAVLACSVQAEAPSYRLLRVQQPPVSRQETSGSWSSFEHQAPAQPYAYGWFGAAPRQHWTRHFGFYRSFTQWSAK